MGFNSHKGCNFVKNNEVLLFIRKDNNITVDIQ